MESSLLAELDSKISFSALEVSSFGDLLAIFGAQKRFFHGGKARYSPHSKVGFGDNEDNPNMNEEVKAWE